MIYLDPSAGFSLSYNMEDHTLTAGGETREGEPRKLEALVPVLVNPEFGREHKDTIAYRMFREVGASPEDRIYLKDKGLRYDVTVLEPLRIGDEYNKTLGHYHPPVPGHEEYSYPEIYQVLKGQALYLIQKRADGEVSRAYLVKARQGDFVVIPPGYGHITINPSLEEPLIMANYVCPNFSSDYEPIKNKRGGVWYVVVGEDGSPSIVPNQSYEKPIEPAVVEPGMDLVREELGVEGPMYNWPFEKPESLVFLSQPWKNETLFSRLEEYWNRTKKREL